MALILPTAGPYLATYLAHASANNVEGFITTRTGLMRHGWLLRWDIKEHRVDDTTSWGRTLIELLYLGADWRLQAQALEYLFTTEMAWPYNGDGAFEPDFTPVGTTFAVRVSGVGQRATNSSSGTLVLAAVAGTEAAGAPATLTAKQAVAGNGSFSFDSRNRELPIDLRLLPSTANESEEDGGTTSWFSVS